MLAWSGSATNQAQAASLSWSQVLGSLPLWTVQSFAKTLTSEAQELLVQHHFKHLADDDQGDLPLPMASEEWAPLSVETLRPIRATRNAAVVCTSRELDRIIARSDGQ